MIIRVVLIAAGLCGCAAPYQKAQPAVVEARMGADGLTVTFPAVTAGATRWPPLLMTSPGDYDWRFGVAGPVGFTASAGVHAGEPGADEAQASIGSVARRLRLRRCEPGGHILTCGWPIAGEVRARDARMVVTVRDSAILARLNETRPAFLWRSIFLPDTIFALDSVRIVYLR